MMLVTRLVLVVTALVLAVHGEEVGTPVAVRDDVVTLAAPTRDRQRVDKGNLTFTGIIRFEKIHTPEELFVDARKTSRTKLRKKDRNNSNAGSSR